jgi:hypothetical protein
MFRIVENPPRLQEKYSLVMQPFDVGDEGKTLFPASLPAQLT